MRENSEIQSTTVPLKDLNILPFNLNCYGTNCPIDDLTKIQEQIKHADALVIATPIWNFSVPGHLKNLIDRMGSFALDTTHSVGILNGKPAYLIITAGMPSGAWPFLKKAMSHVTLALQYFGASVLGMHFEGSCTLGRGQFGLVVDKRPSSLEKAMQEGRQFAVDVERFKDTGVLPLKYRVMRKMVRWMQLVKRRLGL